MKQLRHKNVMAKSGNGSAYVNRLLPADPGLSLLAPCCSALVMLLFVLFGSVYTGGVGTIVCWWRLEIHNRVPRECHCRLLPQLAIVRPGAVAGWLPRQRGVGMLGAHCPSPPALAGPLLGKMCCRCVEGVGEAGRTKATQLHGPSGPQLLHLQNGLSQWETDWRISGILVGFQVHPEVNRRGSLV